MVSAGLPQIARLAGEDKSYSESHFLYPGVDALDPASAGQAVGKPIIEEGATISIDALEEIVTKTQGYPFFLQEWPSKAWDIAEGPEITKPDVVNADPETLASLDEGFFRVRLDRLTPKEIEFVTIMATLGDGPYAMNDIAKILDKKASSLCPVRANTISKGRIYSTEHGFLGFSVPLFAEFTLRQP